MNRNVLKKYTNGNTLITLEERGIPKINSMKGNTLNKLKEGDAQNETQGIGHILKRTHRIESRLLETKGTYK